MGRMSERNKNFTDDWTQTVWQKIASKEWEELCYYPNIIPLKSHGTKTLSII
jgi:hypothetical protein